MMNPLAIIPTYVTNGSDVEILRECLKTLRETTEDERLDVLVVDDGSPDEQVKRTLVRTANEWATMPPILKPENDGFAKTVNVGLKMALAQGRDAILVNADIEFTKKGWLRRMQEQQGLHVSGPAAIVGARLLYPGGKLIQHGGTYFSLLTRDFNHTWQYAPANLPDAQIATTCPVTGALQFIRHEALTRIGVYDEGFKMGLEDVDFCLRALKDGMDCVYQPKVVAIHAESVFRGRGSEKLNAWHEHSYFYFMEKWQAQSFAGLVPFIS